ncbi:Mut7-C RNAse domain-containing protein [Verrucomicrobiota bacterium sgz303538]
MALQPSEIRFAADAMVQSLAKWLRLLGYDCLAGDEWFGRKLVEQAVNEDRWILSRNTNFGHYLPQVLRDQMHLFPVSSQSLPEQMRDVVRHFDLAPEAFLFTRCVECNSPLSEISPAEFQEQLPPDVRAHQARFWRCAQCGRVYWHGSHVARSIERLRTWLAPGAD